MAFKKIEKQNIADEVFQILKREILDGTFKVDDKLPSEAALSEQLGVSKASVRVAVQRLVTLGLLETRVGSGSFVRAFDAGNYLNQMFEFFLSDHDIREITEYRLANEMAITEIAIKKATGKDYLELEAIMRRMNEAMLTKDVLKHSKLDHEFHTKICRMTQNQIFITTYEIIGKQLRQHTTVLNELYIKKATSLKVEDDVHWVLIQAMKRGDLATCRTCYVEMFAVYDTVENE